MNEAVDQYIDKQKSPQKKICEKLRQIIHATFPEITEEMNGGVPCYGCTKKQPCGEYYIASLKDHVNLGFSLKGLTTQQQKLFEGSGKTMKHIKIYTVEDIDEKRIIRLLTMVRRP
jgi:hypothetical protein